MKSPGSRIKSVLVTVTGFIFLLWLALTALLYLQQDRMIFQPTAGLLATPDSVGLDYEDVTLETADGVSLHGWYVPADNSRGVVLFLHGNAGNISHRLATIEIFIRLRLSVFIIDYRGYGRSQGSPHEQGTYRDAEAAWNHLTQIRGMDAGRIVLFGRSLGGAVAAWLATHEQPGAVILESTFTSLEAIARSHYPYVPAGLLLRSHYPTIDYISRIDSPMLFIHSQDDRLIPISHSETLHAAAPASHGLHRLRGGHNDGFLRSSDDYRRALERFLDEILP